MAKLPDVYFITLVASREVKNDGEHQVRGT